MWGVGCGMGGAIQLSWLKDGWAEQSRAVRVCGVCGASGVRGALSVEYSMCGVREVCGVWHAGWGLGCVV